MELHGRRKIFTMADEITEENVLSELLFALTIHEMNVAEEEYLYWYRRGIQPILERKKDIRPEICNHVVVNNAHLVVTFKNGYFLTKPATYVSRSKSEAITKKVTKLNEYLYVSGKHEADNQVVDWFHTVGLGALYIMPVDEDGVPCKAYSLDPRSAFVVYSLNPGNEPVFGVNVVVSGRQAYADVFTKTKVYHFRSGTIEPNIPIPPLHAFPYGQPVSIEDNYIGEIPIIEYEYNSQRMGAFEVAIPIMDAINVVESNRQDSIEQFVQSLMVLYNCQLEEGTTANTIRQQGFIQLKSIGDNKADVKVISEVLDQGQTQVTLNDLYEQMLEKCGVPSSVRDGGSTSDNVGAVYLRSGWAMADTDARNTEDNFKKSNKYFDRIFTKIVGEKTRVKVRPADMELCFARNSMQNILVKSQSAMNMKELGFAPEIAFERSGLSNDPLTDIEVSKEYIEAKWEKGAPQPEMRMNEDIVTDEQANV